MMGTSFAVALPCVAAFALVAGVLIGKRIERNKHEMRRDIGFLIRRPVDLEPSEFLTFWEAPPADFAVEDRLGKLAQ